jgi:hypothetical protein
LVFQLIGWKVRGPGEGRVRQPAGGRKKVEHADYGLLRRLKSILEETTAGDPISPLKWTSVTHAVESIRRWWRLDGKRHYEF